MLTYINIPGFIIFLAWLFEGVKCVLEILKTISFEGLDQTFFVETGGTCLVFMWSLQVYHGFIEIRRTYAIRPLSPGQPFTPDVSSRSAHPSGFIPSFLLCNTSRNYIGQRSPPDRGHLCFAPSSGVRAAWSQCQACGALIVFSLASDADAGSQLQRAAAVQKTKERWFQWRDGGGREEWENPQMYRGESAVMERQIL